MRLALLSDYRMPDGIDGVVEIVAEYVRLLEQLGIYEYFTPVEERVTLSTELSVFKPDPRLFRLAADKILPGVPFEQIAFVIENRSHVTAARALGIVGVQVRMPGPSNHLPTLPEVPALLAEAFDIPPPDPCGGDIHRPRGADLHSSIRKRPRFFPERGDPSPCSPLRPLMTRVKISSTRHVIPSTASTTNWRTSSSG